MASSKISQLQLLQQNLQGVMQQKQQLETDLIETESALAQVESSTHSYRIIGKIMVTVSSHDLVGELQERKATLQMRITNFVRQEDKIKENLETLQQEVLSEMKVKHE